MRKYCIGEGNFKKTTFEFDTGRSTFHDFEAILMTEVVEGLIDLFVEVNTVGDENHTSIGNRFLQSNN